MPKAIKNQFTLTHQNSIKLKFNKNQKLNNNNNNNNENFHNNNNNFHNPIFNTDKFGQHILKNPLIAQSIIDKSNLKNSDKVLEIGPGTGNLTKKILEKSIKKLYLIELDKKMISEILKRFKNQFENFKNLEIFVGDFMKLNLPNFDVCISNTPYQISSPLIFKLLAHRPLFRVAILMFQREFALRLCARPGSSMWSRLSVNAQLYSKITHLMKVGKANFRPPPLVESSVIKLEPINPPPNIKFEEFDGLTRICFSRRNKTIRASFFASKTTKEMLEANWKTWCSQQDQMIIDNQDFSEKLEGILQDSGYSESRAAKMDVDDFLALLACFHKHGIHFA